MVLKELILNSFYFGRKCGGLERTDSLNGVVVFIELSFHIFHFWRESWS